MKVLRELEVPKLATCRRRRCSLSSNVSNLLLAGGSSPVKRLAQGPVASTTTTGVLRIWSPDNSRVSHSIDIQSDLKRALGHRTRSTGSRAHNGAKRRAAPQTTAADGRDVATHRAQRRRNETPPFLKPLADIHQQMR